MPRSFWVGSVRAITVMLSLGCSAGIFQSDVWGAGTPSSYIILLEKIELKDRTGRWITICAPDTEVDLVKSAPSISFFNDGRIPGNTYTNFRITLSGVVKIIGRDGDHRTKEQGYAVVGLEFPSSRQKECQVSSLRSVAETLTTGAQGQMKVEFSSGGSPVTSVIQISAKQDFGPVVINKGTFVHVGFLLDFGGSVRFVPKESLGKGGPAADMMIGLPPRAAQKVELTFGEESRAFEEEALAVSYGGI